MEFLRGSFILGGEKTDLPYPKGRCLKKEARGFAEKVDPNLGKDKDAGEV